MPPVLHPKSSKVDGLAFVGLSLARKTNALGVVVGHPDSVTHQTAFDLNDVLDRDYQYVFSTNDDGWLVGGGEPPITSYKLASPDTAHVEIMRLGTYEPQWGGLDQDFFVSIMSSGQILIPVMSVVPTSVVTNKDVPPELEIRFDMEEPATAGSASSSSSSSSSSSLALPVNWQLRFVHNQLFRHFLFPSRFCPGAFHSTICRKVEFRSEMAKAEYLAKCFRAVETWRQRGPQPLVAPEPLPSSIVQIRPNATTTPVTATSSSSILHEVQSSCNCFPLLDVMDEMLTPGPDNDDKNNDIIVADDDNDDNDEQQQQQPTTTAPLTTSTTTPNSSSSNNNNTQEQQHHDDAGIFLFRDRKTITHYFAPNFFPPYDTVEKQHIIAKILAEQWDEPTLSWKPAVDGIRVSGSVMSVVNVCETRDSSTDSSKADHNNKPPPATCATKMSAVVAVDPPPLPVVQVQNNADPMMIEVTDAIKKTKDNNAPVDTAVVPIVAVEQ